MPIQRCQSGGKSGYKWGEKGHCYTGPGAREKAAKQGRAIERQKHMKGEQSELSGKELVELYLYDDEGK